MKNILKLLCFLPLTVLSQVSETENYVHVTTYQEEVSEAETATTPEDNKIESVTYYDGLGRVKQTTQLRAGGNKEDIIIPVGRDAFGRTTKSYLPYAVDVNNGTYRNNALEELNGFYNTQKYEFTTNPYSETITEVSPINRVEETAAPGNPWAYNAENTQYENPVYIPYPTTATHTSYWTAQEIFYIPDLPDPDDNPILIGENFLSINIANGSLRLRADWDQIVSGTPLLTGKLKRLDVYPAIPYFDMGAIKDKLGNDTDYRIRIEDNYVIIYKTVENPALLAEGIGMDVTYDLTQVQVLSSYTDKHSTNHTTKAIYGLNTVNEVARFDVLITAGIPSLISNGYYPAGELTKVISKDENWTAADNQNRTTEGFTNKSGQSLLQRSYADVPNNGNKAHDTYSVYDDFGNLTFVIPPKVDVTNGVSVSELAELCYQYRYDERNRLIEKKIPGKGLESIVYNRLDQPIMTQDALQQSRNEWLFTKYDPFGRVAYTGLYTTIDTRSVLQNHIDTSGYPVYENRTENVTNSYSNFTDVIGIQVNGSTLTKTATNSFGNAGAATIETLPSDGYLKFSLDPTSLDGAGLSASNIDANYTTIDYAIVSFFGSIAVFEKGNFKGGFGNFQQSDIFKVERVGSLILYKKNEEVFYTSTIPSSDMLIGDISMYNNGAVMEGVALENSYANTTIIGGLDVHYHNQAFPNESVAMEVLTISYYDDYAFGVEDFKTPGIVLMQKITNNTQGLATGSKIKVLGTSDWITTVTYYDEKARPVYIANENTYLSTIDITKMAYNFDGTVKRSQNEHTKDGATIITNDRVTYDHMSRAKAQFNTVNDEEEELIAENFYDELGRLEKKEVGGVKLKQPTTFIDMENVTVSGNTITSDGTALGDSGFATQENISSDGYISFKAGVDSDNVIIGLSSTNMGANQSTITYGILIFPSSGTIQIRESGIYKGSFDGAVSGDVFIVERIGNTIRYYHNDTLLYISLTPAIGPLIGDGSMVYSGSQILDVKLVDTSSEFPNQSLQTVDYTYNIRGWLKDINNVNTLGSDLFSFRVNYDTPEHSGIGNSETNAIKGLYNGNISQTLWKTANDELQRSYGYSYDAMNRLKEAVDNQGHYTVSGIQYDKNGNIRVLTRNGLIPDNQGNDYYGTMDNLIYLYDQQSNQLNTVIDLGNATSTNGFKDGNTTGIDYEYDTNGNMTIDRNKDITDIEYNYMNLPVKVTFGSEMQSRRISYVYDATGTKLSKSVSGEFGASSKVTQYAGGFVYEKPSSPGGCAGCPQPELTLKFFGHQEGYIESDGNGNFSYIYQFTDHLGNIRLSYSDKDGDGRVDVLRNNTDIDGDGDNAHEILAENNYYPFGLQHKGYNNTITGREHDYGFGSKEKQNELGLNWNDYGWRNYDPAIGKWMNPDPLSEKYYDKSPYNYSLNNPVFFIDPDGRSVDVTDLVNGGTETDTWLLINLMANLSETSGSVIKITTSRDGVSTLVEGECKPNCKESTEAAGYVSHLLGNDSGTITVKNNDRNTRQTSDGRQFKEFGSQANPNGEIYLDAIQISDIQYSLQSSGVDPRTMDTGFVFLHESLHTKFGASYFKSSKDNREKEGGRFRDPSGVFAKAVFAGPTVERVNKYRRQIGLPLRRSYSNWNPKNPGSLVIEKEGNRIEVPIINYNMLFYK